MAIHQRNYPYGKILMANVARGRTPLDDSRSDGSDADEGSHVEAMCTINFPYGDLEEAGAKRSRGEPTSTTPGPEPGPTASGSRRPPSSELVTSPTKRTSKKARVSRGAGPIHVTNKIANPAARAKRAARSTAAG